MPCQQNRIYLENIRHRLRNIVNYVSVNDEFYNVYVVYVVFFLKLLNKASYRSGTLNSNTVNSKFHLIRSFFEIFARFLSFHV